MIGRLEGGVQGCRLSVQLRCRAVRGLGCGVVEGTRTGTVGTGDGRRPAIEE